MSDADRLTRVEEKLTHLEHDLSQLDGVVRELGARIVQQDRTIAGLRRQLDQLLERPQPPASADDPAAERPPHW